MAARTGVNLSTYTIGTTEEDKKIEKMPADEKYARQVAEQFHFDHHEIMVKADIINDLPKMVYMLDEPIGDPAALNTYLICKSARERGVKVLLSGMGADELFFGYRRQRATLLTIRYQRIPRFLRKPLESIAGSLPVKAFGKGIRLARWLKRFLSFAELSPEEAYMRSYSYYDGKELQELFQADISVPYHKLREQHKHFYFDNGFDEPINKMCYTDVHLFMTGLNLTYTDRASMAASVEVRVPFIDKEVVQTALEIAGNLKYKKKQQKYILKKVAEKYLPHSIIYRPKASFGAPIRSWISHDLKALTDELLSERQVKARGLFNYDFIKKLIEEDRKGTADHAYRIYQLITLELWLRQYVDSPVTPSPA
jgi:asparagine synthase (glutamine-hydrolysing)